MRLTRFEKNHIQRRFQRGRERPRGVAWFGVRSFWGHLQHFVASAIATEDIDSRDWMTPDDPRALAERVARLLGAAQPGATVTERIGRDLWIDYLADTGDDLEVSRAVARMVFSQYELPDPENEQRTLLAPRGDVLFFGGDTAYPVATADEIQTRVIAPFNQVLAERDDGRRRVLLGIPGNHDWYDGLDGFARMFRRHVDYDDSGQARPTLHGSTRTLIGHYAEWAREFVRGGRVGKPTALALVGYTAVQSASYFLLPLAPRIPLVAVDRQLKHVDHRQRSFFSGYLNQHLASSPFVALADPVYAFGAPSPTGVATINALGLTLSARPHFVLSGDIHHYRREQDGPTMHVIAGGGGAFLHPAPVGRHVERPAVAEWPGREQSRALLRQVPLKVALGRSGFIPHFALALLLEPIVLARENATWMLATTAAVVVALTIVLALIGGARKGRRRVWPLAGIFASAVGALALATEYLLDLAAHSFAAVAPSVVISGVHLLGSVLCGVALFGSYLATLTVLGYEHTQAFTALDHPGFKHFVRLRVRHDGTAIDGWCIGLVDPVSARAAPVVVDTFSWRAR